MSGCSKLWSAGGGGNMAVGDASAVGIPAENNEGYGNL